MEHIIVETSLLDLYQSAVHAFPNTTKRQYATGPINLKQWRFIPYLGMKTLFVGANAVNEDREYSPVMLFKNINYNQNNLEIIGYDGKKYQLDRLSLENTNVSLRCQCKDFYWRFNYYNHLDKSLYGAKRKQYESITGRQANPQEMPGMCKHLMKMMEALNNSGVFND